MKIDKVVLNNFRCFEKLEVTFHPQMTVEIAATAHLPFATDIKHTLQHD